MQAPKAIIIGSGIGGMATAIRLSIQGFDVTVYESNDYAGGKLSFFEKDGFKFDAGPSLFTQPQNIEELFSLANEPIDKYFNYQSIDVACKYFFENGKIIYAYTDQLKYAAELEDKLGERSFALKKYLIAAEKLYNNIGLVFLNHSLHKRGTWLHRRIIKAFQTLRLSYITGTMHEHNSKSFVSKEAVQIFNRFATYNGSNPYKAPGMLSLIPHLEQTQGTYYPKGGMISITEALHQLAIKKGVKFVFNSNVSSISHKSNVVTGVVVNNQFIPANIVVSNADVYFTHKYLLNDATRSKKILSLERSSSAMIFYWGIKKSFTQLGLHNILFSDSYKEEFDHLFTKKTLIGDPTIYINITSKMESSHAPAQQENWFVMINVPANVGQNWNECAIQARKAVIHKINRLLNTDLESLIVSETMMDPVQIEQKTGSFMGSLYGTSSNNVFAAFLRPANFSTQYKGLYFCGGTVHPGGGIPLCLKSAYIASELIKKDTKKLFNKK